MMNHRHTRSKHSDPAKPVKNRTRGRSATNLKVLFIGNSFTARNDLPCLINRLAAAAGKSFQHDLISAGGASLRTHWNAGHAAKMIATGEYDYVVLQEQSTLPIKNPKRMHENVRLFDTSIKAARAKTVLYLTWARQNACHSQQAITDAYIEIGEELGAIVVPVGLAWHQFLDQSAEPLLYDRDQSHPTRAGSYLAACVFYSVLFKESPVGIQREIEGLSTDATDMLQKAAWQTCKSGK
jgi:hypothetical protein